MPLTLISHFWNEEFLLPFWLKHHVPIFDHAVLIDYGSTDRSREIIRELASRWEVRTSRNQCFDAREVDQEVMAIEREFPGWKMALNTTEFLVCRDLRFLLRNLEKYRPDLSGLWAYDLTIVDPPDRREEEVSDAPLLQQKHFGYHSGGKRARVLHKHPDGRYEPGRHMSPVVPRVLDDSCYVAWFGWAPMRYVAERKLKIQSRIPASDRAAGYGIHHFMTADELEARYRREAGFTYDLWEKHPAYAELVQPDLHQGAWSHG